MPEYNDILGAEARAVIEADFKEIQPQPERKTLGTRIKDALGQWIKPRQRA